MKAKRSLWIGTADIKDLYVLQGKIEKPFLEAGILTDEPSIVAAAIEEFDKVWRGSARNASGGTCVRIRLCSVTSNLAFAAG